MKFGAKWNVKGVRPQARDTAREAARRSGVSVGEWLNNAIIEYATEEGIAPQRNARYAGSDRRRGNEHLANAVDRLDRRLDRIIARNNFSAPSSGWRPGPEYYVARHQLPPPYAAQPQMPQSYPPQAAGPTAWAAPAYRNSPPGGLDDAVAEIAARQQVLDGAAAVTPPPQTPAAWYPPAPPFAPGANAGSPMLDFSGLQQQLRYITDQLEKLHRPSDLENAVGALREELAEIGKKLTEAMPRRAVEALEAEIRALAQRIDQTRQCGVDPVTIAGMERTLVEMREALRTLTPAENLAGLNEAIHGIARKIDLMATISQDPGSLQQLEAAITALRGIVSHVASNETLTKLGEEMRGLSAKIERVEHSPATAGADAISALEQRVAALADQLKARAAGPLPPQLENLVKAVNEKLDQIQLSRGDKAAFGHLEDRIVNLVEKLDASDTRLNHLGAVERGIADLLVRIEQVRAAGWPSSQETAAASSVDALKRDISSTQESLESVHGTLGQVVDRLAVIENDIRMNAVSAATAPKPQAVPGDALPAPDSPAAKSTAQAQSAPAQIETPIAKPAILAGEPAPTPARPETAPPSAPVAAKGQTSAPAKTAKPSGLPAAMPVKPAVSMPAQRGGQRPIDPTLPPDYPLEPGSGGPRERISATSAAERIAESEAALGPARTAAPGPAAQSNFIAAARRAAQAATPSFAPGATREELGKHNASTEEEEGKNGGRLAKRVRSLLVGTSIVLIVIGGLNVVMNLLDPSNHADTPTTIPQPQSPARTKAVPENGSKTAPVEPGSQSSLPRSGAEDDDDKADLAETTDVQKNSADKDDVTGSLPPVAASSPSSGPSELPFIPEKLPHALRAAAVARDAAAAYEIALRYLDGRGLTANLNEAARWMEHAAKGGLAPAQFRLGSLYEKGQGVKKDLTAARRLYQAAAEQGNAKAMHNLAVLYAEGIDGKPDYKQAALWFRRGADRGVADSQYNLAILYARGIGVTQNLAESYKWFSLAAAQGDKDSAGKRDEIAARLDQTSLTAARLAVQTWVAEPQPAKATAVKGPPGGWEKTAETMPPRKISTAKKPKTSAPMQITPQ